MPIGRRTRSARIVVLLAALAAGCTSATGQDVSAAQRGVSAVPSTTVPSTTVPPTTVPPTTAPSTTVRAARAPSTTVPSTTVPSITSPAPPPSPAGGRPVHQQPWTPFARVGGIVLRHPSARVERIGYHQSNNDGARQLEPLPGSAPHLTLDARETRATTSHTAADVMMDPEGEVRSPVTGRVLHAGTYILYCDYRDDFVIISPDDRPAWEVKVLHIDGVAVRVGARVTAGETVIAPRPTRLPFESQVEETSARPAWPHVHIEVIDPSIRDIPNGKGC